MNCKDCKYYLSSNCYVYPSPFSISTDRPTCKEFKVDMQSPDTIESRLHSHVNSMFSFIKKEAINNNNVEALEIYKEITQ